MKIPNATPMSYNTGMHDVSGRKLRPQPLDQPSHLPKVFGFFQKGKVGKSHLVVGDSRAMIYGLSSFDPLKQYFNHATAFANIFNAAGNAVMMERVLPEDAKPPAAVRLSLDLLPTLVQDYERNIDGSYRVDNAGVKVPTATKIPGYLGKWVAEPIEIDEGVRAFGQGSIMDGDQLDGVTTTQSTRYPIMDLMVSSEGSWGNDFGVSIWALTSMSDTAVDERLITDQKVYPFQIAVKARQDGLTTPSIVTTLGGGQSIPFVLKPKTIDRNTEAQMYLGDVFVDAYQDIKSKGISPTYGAFDRLKIYDSNVKTALDLLYAAEFPHADNFSDFDGSDDESYRFNPFSAVSSNNVPYHSFQLVTGSPNSLRMVATSTVFARDGFDGTMNDEVFDLLVRAKLQEYGDKNSYRQDSVNHPENIIWDSGHSLATKKAMANFIAVRKGTYVQASTHVVGGPPLSDDQERSVAISLMTAFQNFPESETYATPTVRASIIAGSGHLLASKYTEEVPASIDRAAKWSAYMGATNGKWISRLKPDVSPNNQVSLLSDLNVVFRPATARYKDWDAGMVWPEPYTMDTQYFPQHQTVYPDDTSVLNSAITAFGCTTLIAVGEKAHRDNTGRSDLTKDQMVASINSNILEQVDGKYDDRFIIIPETTYTADDDLRGYSWTTVIKVGAPMMQTVQTLTIETYRKEDLQQ
jgi:hypothetical protein